MEGSFAFEMADPMEEWFLDGSGTSSSPFTSDSSEAPRIDSLAIGHEAIAAADWSSFLFANSGTTVEPVGPSKQVAIKRPRHDDDGDCTSSLISSSTGEPTLGPEKSPEWTCKTSSPLDFELVFEYMKRAQAFARYSTALARPHFILESGEASPEGQLYYDGVIKRGIGTDTWTARGGRKNTHDSKPAQIKGLPNDMIIRRSYGTLRVGGQGRPEKSYLFHEYKILKHDGQDGPPDKAYKRYNEKVTISGTPTEGKLFHVLLGKDAKTDEACTWDPVAQLALVRALPPINEAPIPLPLGIASDRGGNRAEAAGGRREVAAGAYAGRASALFAPTQLPAHEAHEAQRPAPAVAPAVASRPAAVPLAATGAPTPTSRGEGGTGRGGRRAGKTPRQGRTRKDGAGAMSGGRSNTSVEAITGRLDTQDTAHTIRGDLTMELGVHSRSGTDWVTFTDATGWSQGRITQGQRGAVFQTRSGDFAEWYMIAPGEAPFEEGDVVAIDEWSHLTRRTGNATQIAVISRWAAMEGSWDPAKTDRHLYDRVAYSGNVSVKLRGGCASGEFIVPSGLDDGTAIAVKGRRAKTPPMRLGRAIVNIDAPEERKPNEFELQASTDKGTQISWALATISVINPADTVRSHVKPSASRLPTWIRGTVVLAALLLALVLGLFNAGIFVELNRSPTALSDNSNPKTQCAPMTLAHGVVEGGCNGTLSSSCTYVGCESGYVLQQTSNTGISENSSTVGPVSTGSEGTTRSSSYDLVYPACSTCYGDGLFCQGSNGSCIMCKTSPIQSVPQPLGHAVSSERNLNKSCSGCAGTICAANPWPCTCCDSPAPGSDTLACEVSGGGLAGPWGSKPPSEAGSLVTDRISGWDRDRNVNCLSARPARCLPKLLNVDNYWESYPTDCDVSSVQECGSMLQARYLQACGFGSSCLSTNGFPVDWNVRICQVMPTSTRRREPQYQQPAKRTREAKNEQDEEMVAAFVEQADLRNKLLVKNANSKTRTCTCETGGDGDECQPAYSGKSMSCNALYCGADIVSTLMMGRCEQCDGKDAILVFPTTRVGQTHSISCPASTHHGQVNRTCEENGWGRIVGFCSRKTCAQTKLDLSPGLFAFLSVGPTSPWPGLGPDYRKYSQLSGYPTIYLTPVSPVQAAGQHCGHNTGCTSRCSLPDSNGVVRCTKLDSIQQLGAAVTFEETPEGNEVTMKCPDNPRHQFTGNVSWLCPSHSSEWITAVRGGCTPINRCPAGKHHFSSSSAGAAGLSGWIFNMPAADSGTSVQLDCCQRFTKAGGCADNPNNAGSGFGMITVTCGTDGEWPDKPTSGTCKPTSTIKYRMDSDHAAAMEAFQNFRGNVQTSIDCAGSADCDGCRQAAGLAQSDIVCDPSVAKDSRRWLLPSTGALMSISVKVEQPASKKQSSLARATAAAAWKPLATFNSHAHQLPIKKRRNPFYYATLSSSHNTPHAGRDAAAVASVACQQLGFQRAAIAMNCGALVLLELRQHWSNFTCRQAKMEWTSPEHAGIPAYEAGWECKEWEGQPSALLLQLCGQEDGTIDFNALLPWSGMGSDIVSETDSEHRSKTVHSAVGWAASVVDGDKLSDVVHLHNSRGPTSSACVGNESSLTQCFREPLLRRATNMWPLLGQAESINKECSGGCPGGCPDEDAYGCNTVNVRQKLLVGCSNEEGDLANGSGIHVLGDLVRQA